MKDEDHDNNDRNTFNTSGLKAYSTEESYKQKSCSSSSSGNKDITDSSIYKNNINLLYEITKEYAPVLGEIAITILGVYVSSSLKGYLVEEHLSALNDFTSFFGESLYQNLQIIESY